MKVFKLLKNRYFAVATLFVLWMLFFDSSSLLKIVTQKIVNRELRKEIDKYKRDALELEQETNAIKHSNDSLEKFARETFYLKKEGEEVFLIVD